MITINYEFRVPPSTPYSTIAWYMHWETITGETGEEIQAKASARCKALQAIDYMAVGLHNRKADWEAAFGPPDDPRSANYADTWDPRPPPTRDWRAWLSKFNPLAHR
jgi:hypothetical protein